ncbi:MAG: glycosyltransferase, partial [Vagococcus salmoninarum]|uniref:glycosyltransferase n=1 Tax=Vagococcus salmoninarum TaxID=2739 RepID=UPI003F960191
MIATEDFIKVSIIVPIYNVENYLEECIDSLINQSLSGLQIILIDDGSPDSSGIIADKYSEKYENVEVYHIPNGGLGHARNYGIQYVKGKYVAFVDSDDIMVPDAYELMYKKAEKNDSDIVVCSAKRFNSRKSYSSFLHRNFIEEDVEKTSIRENPKLVF